MFLYNGSLKSVFAPNLMELALSRKPLMVSKVAFTSFDHPQELVGLARKLSTALIQMRKRRPENSPLHQGGVGLRGSRSERRAHSQQAGG